MKHTSSYQKGFKAALAATVATGALVATVPALTQAEETNTTQFPDVKEDHDFYDAVMNLTERGIIKGFPDGEFKPSNSITRGQAAKILAMVLDLDIENVEDPGFSDVTKTDEYYGPIAALAKAGIIIGYTNDDGIKEFKPAITLTRSQMAKIIVKGFEFEEEELTDDRFEDVKVDDEFANYVQTLLTHEITVGTTDTTFSPATNVSRSQLALFVTRAENALEETELTDAELLDLVVKELNDLAEWNIIVSGGEEANNEAKVLAVKTTIDEILDGTEIEVTVTKAEEDDAYIVKLTKGEETVTITIDEVSFEVTEGEAANAKFVEDLKAAEFGDTILLTHNVSVSEPVVPAAGVIIDGAGFELNVATEGNGATTAEGVFLSEVDITLKNIIITGTHGDNLIEIYNDATLENVTVKGSKKAGIYVNNIAHETMNVVFNKITTEDNTWAGIGISANEALTVKASFTGMHSFNEHPVVYTEGTNAGKGTMSVTGLDAYTKLDSGEEKTEEDVKEGQTKQVWYMNK